MTVCSYEYWCVIYWLNVPWVGLLVFSLNYFSLKNLNVLQEEILFLTYEEGLRLQEVSASPERDVSDKVSILNTSKKTEEEPLGLCAPSNIDANELAFKRLARSVFEQQQPESTSAVIFKILCLVYCILLKFCWECL